MMARAIRWVCRRHPVELALAVLAVLACTLISVKAAVNLVGAYVITRLAIRAARGD